MNLGKHKIMTYEFHTGGTVLESLDFLGRHGLLFNETTEAYRRLRPKCMKYRR